MLKIIMLVLQIVFWSVISWKDIRTQIIPVWPELLFGLVGMVAAVASGISIWETVGGAVAGVVLVAFAYLSRESVGYGDALCVGVLGIWNGLSSMVWILMCAMFLLLAAAIPLLFLKKVNRKTKMPMAPFLTAGMILIEIPAVWMTL